MAKQRSITEPISDEDAVHLLAMDRAGYGLDGVQAAQLERFLRDRAPDLRLKERLPVFVLGSKPSRYYGGAEVWWKTEDLVDRLRKLARDYEGDLQKKMWLDRGFDPLFLNPWYPRTWDLRTVAHLADVLGWEIVLREKSEKEKPAVVPTRKLGELFPEKTYEYLIWCYPEAVFDEPLFMVGRQFTFGTRGRPDIVALDQEGRLVVIEVKREAQESVVEQLTRYVQGAREVTSQELSIKYRDSLGVGHLGSDWAEFSDADLPEIENRQVRSILVYVEISEKLAKRITRSSRPDAPIDLVRIGVEPEKPGRFSIQSATHPAGSKSRPLAEQLAGSWPLWSRRTVVPAPQFNLGQSGSKRNEYSKLYPLPEGGLT